MQRNVAAIRVVKALVEEKRLATPRRAIPVKYVTWDAFSPVSSPFPRHVCTSDVLIETTQGMRTSTTRYPCRRLSVIVVASVDHAPGTQQILLTLAPRLVKSLYLCLLSSYKGASVPVNVRASLQKALNQLHIDRAHVDRQISALTDALSAIGGRVRKGAATARRAVKRAAKRTRRKMTSAQKRAASKRMKAYWAKRRTQSGK